MTPRPWYRVVVTDKPDYYGNTVWIWRIVNRWGAIVGQGVVQYSSESQARKASRRILEGITWRSGTTIKTNR